jgi:protein TonB
MSAEESASHLLEHPAPKYPFGARVKRIQGKVVLSGTIRKDGTIGDLKVVCGDERLAKSALKAVARWRYQPFEWKGKIVEAATFVVVNFELEKK